ncbi:hypothetical protein [Nannocystis radixulma]|uniref:Uncharacterized protein n=1 Tax=Nannocystis radixulma TaxID=2995305 RepID=A0ABT5AZM6_9BACT|nr:hypothetical protein [Nannocystis radixulma]MDC0667286.1 hypothetical protein [Nannocystis radixulma]
MVRRATLLLVLAAFGCAPTTSTQAPPERPAARAEAARTRRPPAVFVQAIAELERNPNLCLRLVGPRAEPVRKAMLRAARGRIDDTRIVVESDPVEPALRPVEYRFFVAPSAASSGPGLHTIHAYMPQ